MGHNNKDGYSRRRDFLKGTLATAALAATGGLWLPAAASAQEAPPKKGGRIRLGLSGANTTDSYDPGSWIDSFTFVAFSTLHNTLVEIDPNGLAVPELAQSWERSADVKRWTFKLR